MCVQSIRQRVSLLCVPSLLDSVFRCCVCPVYYAACFAVVCTQFIRQRVSLLCVPGLLHSVFHCLMICPSNFIAKTVFRLAVNLALEPACQTRWFIWLKLFLDWWQLSCYHGFVSGIQAGSLNYFEISANLTGPWKTLFLNDFVPPPARLALFSTFYTVVYNAYLHSVRNNSLKNI